MAASSFLGRLFCSRLNYFQYMFACVADVAPYFRMHSKVVKQIRADRLFALFYADGLHVQLFAMALYKVEQRRKGTTSDSGMHTLVGRDAYKILFGEKSGFTGLAWLIGVCGGEFQKCSQLFGGLVAYAPNLSTSF